MKYRAYFDIPVDTDTKNIKGSSPYLLEKLIGELDNASEIKLSFFLYNNPFLHDMLEGLSEKGCSVNIYSIPLNGYTKKTVPIHIPTKNGSLNSSKYIYAEKIYRRIEKKLFPNIKLRIFPHTYVWYKQLFSRGKEAYSLHNKSILVKMRDGSTKCISLSSNLAFADPPHSDNLLVVENEQYTISMFERYFDLLEGHSLSLADYKEFSKSNYDFQYPVMPTDLNPNNYNGCYYTAPFITYNKLGSNHFVQNQIIDFIKSTKQRIYICSQHFMDINPFDKSAKSIVAAIGELSNSKPWVEIKVLKQTRSSNQAQGKRTHLAEEYLKRINNAEQRYLSPMVHDKFIIVDNKIVVMTANITPTQFAWAYPYKMKYEVNNRFYNIENCFSEINSFHFIEDDELTESYRAHFQALWTISNII
ncbi:phospholipase D family protein [Bacillales bacterium AN1005]